MPAKPEPLTLALPKGRVLDAVLPLMKRAGIEPEPAFADPDDRRLRFATNRPEVSIVRVRSFDVATFVAFGAAELGVAGSDVLMEFDYDEIYAPVDLKVARCRLIVAEPAQLASDDDPTRWSHIRVATKYPALTRKHFA
jgi:ATP phosphoribosyltransferase